MFFYTVMKTPIVYLLFMIVLYLSCSPRPQSPADIHTDLSNNKILQLSELFDRIRYIPLETPDTALIANVQSVTYHNGRYYLIAENTLMFSTATGNTSPSITTGDGEQTNTAVSSK